MLISNNRFKDFAQWRTTQSQRTTQAEIRCLMSPITWFDEPRVHAIA